MNGLSKARPRNMLVVLAVLGMLASVAHAAPVELTNGVPLTGLSGTIGSEQFYMIAVPAGQDELDIAISGGTGDCDLYVRRGALPTTTSYDYRPYQVGNAEDVHIDSPADGIWYIMLRGYTAYSGLTLAATYSASVSIVPLANGVPVPGLAGATGSELYFTIEVPAGQSKLQIATSNGTGDCDLYVKQGALPTLSDYDYRPFLLGNNETVTVDNPTPGTWYIMLRGYNAYAGVTLLASHGGGVGTELQNGVPVPNLAGAASSEKVYRIEVPAGQSNLEIMISGGTGDADLYVKLGARPTTSDYDYRPFLAGNDETVAIENPAAGTWYIVIRGYSNYSGVTLRAMYGDVLALQDDVPVPNLSAALNELIFYKIDVPSGQAALEIKTFGGTGNCDLYVKWGAKPSVVDWQYRPYLPGNDETVTINNPQSGTWYIMLRARQAFSNVTLNADYWFMGSVTLLSNGVPVTNINGLEGSEKYYRLIVPSDQTKLEFEISGGTGDADLYVQLDSPPTTTDYDYRPYQIGNNEKVTIDNPPYGNWLVMIRGYHDYAGLTLVGTFENTGGGGGDAIPLSNGVPVPNLAGAAGSQVFYKIDVPSGQAQLDIQISGGTGDVDLYVREGAKPTTTEWDYRPYLLGNDETVTINTPTAGTYYIMLNAYSPYTGVTLVATYTPLVEEVITLTNGVPVTHLTGTTGSEAFYKIVVPAGQDFLNIAISGGTGDCDLHVKKGSKPTASSWDYRPYLIGNNETVEIVNPAAATYYIMLSAYQAYADMSLVATYGVTAVGNNFASDPNCVALWRFEAGKLAADSIGTNTLENKGVVADAGAFQEGAASARFVRSEGDYFAITDANLSDGFPLKSNDVTKKVSVATWCKLDTLPSTYQAQSLIGKFDETTGKRSFLLIAATDAFNNTYFELALGYNLGNSAHWGRLTDLPIQPDRWYHVAVTYNDPDKSYRIRVWDDASETVTEKVGIADFGFSTTLNVEDVPLMIGSWSSSHHNFDGLIDEMVVFNDVLTAVEIDKVREGTYGKP